EVEDGLGDAGLILGASAVLKDPYAMAIYIRLRGLPDFHTDLRSHIQRKSGPDVGRRDPIGRPAGNGWHPQPLLSIGILPKHLGAVPDLDLVGIRCLNVVIPGSPYVRLHGDEISHP